MAIKILVGQCTAWIESSGVSFSGQCGALGFIIITALVVGLPVLISDLVYYCVFVSPDYFLERPKSRKNFHPTITRWVILTAYALSVLRLPFILLPYGVKVLLFVALRKRYVLVWNRYTFQFIRLFGDFANLFLTAVLLFLLVDFVPISGLKLIVYGCVTAEIIRLILEKGQTIFCGVWHRLPHRAVVKWREGHGRSGNKIFNRYQRYYALAANRQAEFVFQRMNELTQETADTADKLRYATGYRIVPDDIALRAGNVRDIVGGEIYIHENWANDPWLLAGQLLRRTPWFFDPRYLQRPFYYRTQTNRLATEFVLQWGFYVLPYGWYQIGQEIKAARYDLFFRVVRRLGLPLESAVRIDGAYSFEPLLRWVDRRLGLAVFEAEKRPLLSELEMKHLAKAEEWLTDLELARRCACSLLYVEEVLRSNDALHKDGLLVEGLQDERNDGVG